MSQVVQVDIHGQRYAVRSDLDPQYINELAAYLDEMMRAAALNISDELQRARTDKRGIEDRVQKRAAEIERMVDAVLDNARLKVVNE